MPYQKICKTVQIRPPRKYKVKDVVRIAGYVSATGKTAYMIAAIAKKVGVLEHICTIAAFTNLFRSVISAIAAAGISKALITAVDYLIQLWARRGGVILVKTPQSALIYAAVLAILTAVYQVLQNLDAALSYAGDLLEAIDFLTEICSIGDEIILDSINF